MKPSIKLTIDHTRATRRGGNFLKNITYYSEKKQNFISKIYIIFYCLIRLIFQILAVKILNHSTRICAECESFNGHIFLLYTELNKTI